MGIKLLNRFIKMKCGEDAIQSVTYDQLSNKKIAVDISIYMYKFIGENALIANMYTMIAWFRHYNIIPIFVFDGKPPSEKDEILAKRKADKYEARKMYEELQGQLSTADEEKQIELNTNMRLLKKQFIHVKDKDIQEVKKLMRAYGVTYYDSPGEADQLCVLLLKENKVWACMSDDMDMFVYGCSRVLRYVNIGKQTAVLYSMSKILECLDLSIYEFRKICLLSGTDYYFAFQTEHTIIDSYQLYLEYRSSYSDVDFYEWLMQKGLVSKEEWDKLRKIDSMFDIRNEIYDSLKRFDSVSIINSYVDELTVKEIMKPAWFLWIHVDVDHTS